MIKDAALTSVHLLRNLPAGEAENFAVALQDRVAELIVKQQAQTARQAEAPLELPDPLPKPNVCIFPSSQKRAMMGHEAAEQAEVDAALAHQRQQHEAEATLEEGQRIQARMREEILQISQRDTQLEVAGSSQQAPITLSSASSSSSSFLSLSDSYNNDPPALEDLGTSRLRCV